MSHTLNVVAISGSLQRPSRTLALTDLHRLPEDRPELDTVLAPGELITEIELPPLPFAARVEAGCSATEPRTAALRRESHA